MLQVKSTTAQNITPDLIRIVTQSTIKKKKKANECLFTDTKYKPHSLHQVYLNPHGQFKPTTLGIGPIFLHNSIIPVRWRFHEGLEKVPGCRFTRSNWVNKFSYGLFDTSLDKNLSIVFHTKVNPSRWLCNIMGNVYSKVPYFIYVGNIYIIPIKRPDINLL